MRVLLGGAVPSMSEAFGAPVSSALELGSSAGAGLLLLPLLCSTSAARFDCWCTASGAVLGMCTIRYS